MKKLISLASDFTDAPGGRRRSQGLYSGEEFRDDILLPALEAHELVEVDLDGALGLPPSFLDEAFGELARLHKAMLPKLIVRLSENEPAKRILRACLPPSALDIR